MKNIYLQGMNKISAALNEMSSEYSKIFKGNFFAYRDLERKRASLMGALFDDPDDWYRIYGKVVECHVDITNDRPFNGFHGILVLKYLPLDDLNLSFDLQVERELKIHLGKIDRYICAPDLDALKLLLEVEE